MTPTAAAGAGRVRAATAADVAGCAELYAQGFERGLRALFGRLPKAALLEDMLAAYRAAEPQGFLVWAGEQRADGYLLVTPSLSGLARRIAFSTAPLRGFVRLLRGGYGIGHPRFLLPAARRLLQFAGSAGRFRQSGDAQIVSIAIRDGLRGAGAGHALMLAGLHYLEAASVTEVRLEVQPDNAAAQRLYLRLGFVMRGEIPSPLGRALVMTCAVPSPSPSPSAGRAAGSGAVS